MDAMSTNVDELLQKFATLFEDLQIDNQLSGGRVLGEGSQAIVISPAIPCSLEDPKNDKLVSKLFKYETADDESAKQSYAREVRNTSLFVKLSELNAQFKMNPEFGYAPFIVPIIKKDCESIPVELLAEETQADIQRAQTLGGNLFGGALHGGSSLDAAFQAVVSTAAFPAQVLVERAKIVADMNKERAAVEEAQAEEKEEEEAAEEEAEAEAAIQNTGQLTFYNLAKVYPVTDKSSVLDIAKRRLKTMIDTLHENGIAHGDISPDNYGYLDTSKTQPVLFDWGLSLMEKEDADDYATLKTADLLNYEKYIQNAQLLQKKRARRPSYDGSPRFSSEAPLFKALFSE